MDDFWSKLNPEQERAVKQIDGPLLILAGAGSGKTRVITCRAAHMVKDCGVNPFNILAITFTNKAADEMRNRVDRMAGSDAAGIWVSTFHSLCVRILRRYIDRIGYENTFTIYDADDQKTVMKEVCKRLNIDTKQMPERALLSMISHQKDELLTVSDTEREAADDYAMKELARVYKAYQETLRKNNALDFDDLLFRTVDLFRAAPDVLSSYQERFRYIMVDEYQDTNTAQFELVRLLASRYRNICVVGDDDQSIYKFRGANIRNILDFESVYPDAAVIRLEQNYRSTQTILDAANAVIKNNRGRKDKSLWSDRGKGEGLQIRRCDTAYEEAEFVADRIKSKKLREGIAWRDAAVLYRTNAQSRLLEEKLLMAGIPYTIVGGVNFYARREIKDLLAYLKTIDNARDDLAVRRIINVPRRGIGQTTINKIENYALNHGLTFYEALQSAEKIGLGKTAEKIAGFVSMIERFRRFLTEANLEDLVNEILDETEYVEKMDAADETEAKTRVENIEEFINKVVSFEEEEEEIRTEDETLSLPGDGPDENGSAVRQRSILSRFLEEVALVADIDTVSEDDNRVLLMTLHSAKGLEFPIVFMTGMEEGLFPGFGAVASNDPMELEEERRLCYVGITRAKDELTFVTARSRMLRGETQYHAPSRFLDEIPSGLFSDQAGNRIRAQKTAQISRESRPAASSGQSAFRQKPYSFTQAAPVKKKAFPLPLTKGSELQTGVTPDYKAGDRVRHVKFGEGEVKSIVKGARDYEVTVDFDTAGVKKMFAGFAKLVRI
ncbi:MAG: UvrD-helicase domain-containing protein [Lachnospiraceae bacterium]|nr:UvrD-helicase domain-containing protein [Lachnospiraceae bacterium]